MDLILIELTAECNRAALDFLSIEGWYCPKRKVKDAVDEICAGSPRASSRMAWLLRQTEDLPVQMEPNRRLHDLVCAISALRQRQNALAWSPGAEQPQENLLQHAS